MTVSSPSGLRHVPELEWGSHFAHLFRSAEDLRDTLVPYFKAGLENNERCLWVADEPFFAEEARCMLRAALPDLDNRERSGQIEIVNAHEWYSADEKLDPAGLVAGLLTLEQEALGQGYAGLRTNGNCAWVGHDQWTEFLDYEMGVQDLVRGRRMICLCSYCSSDLSADSQLDVIERHDMAIPAGPSTAARSSRPGDQNAREHVDHDQVERERRTFALAMTASQMGTWRFTLADGICVYDENAQRLYGLTEPVFLHDEAGVAAKFHPDDQDPMWARVAEALDQAGDGRYDVEYRVKQLDGSWRWLSAWGLVEWDSEGPDRRAVAISGASRDLTERKAAEQLQALLLNELNHRVKNTLATVQGISAQTLRTARDLPAAREALDRRIISLAQAHDLLTARSWTGANVEDIVSRTFAAFNPSQVMFAGAAIDVSPKHTLALSLSLHELATNAVKYGSLSTAQGRVRVHWREAEGRLDLEWRESDGPAVTAPARTGFGTRLLKQVLAQDLEGKVEQDFDASGLRCRIQVKL
jgi:two-component sensor histidine kinase/PAS domain-containing protein